MSDLTVVEKRKLEKFLGMESGYVLDFSNRSFGQFVIDSTGRNIYDSRYDYGSGSKANRMRAFWQKEENSVVGKLLKDILDYSEDTGAQAEMCRLIVARLLGSGSNPPAAFSHDDERSKQQLRALRELEEQFFLLASESDRSRAGLALEKLLNRLFKIFEARAETIVSCCGRTDRRVIPVGRRNLLIGIEMGEGATTGSSSVGIPRKDRK